MQPDLHQLTPLAHNLYHTIKNSSIPIWKYPEEESITEIMSFYWTLFDIIESRNKKCVLDFGCGFGMSKIVHNLGHWNFSLDLGDSNTSWIKNEMKAFNYVLKRHKIKPLRFTNLLLNDFRFITPPLHKFDCVITVRFPPVSTLKIMPTAFKEKLARYCTNNFEYMYLHKSLKALTDANLPNEAASLMKDTSHKAEYSSNTSLVRVY